MSGTPARNYSHIAIAIVVAAVVVSASILLAATDKTTTTPLIIGTTTITNTATQLSTATTTQLSIVTLTSLSTTTSVQTQTLVTQVNYTTTVTDTQTTTGLDYLSDLPGCAVSEGYISDPTPCFGQISTAVAFNCEAAAATSNGCNQQVNFTGTSDQSMNITVWYPYFSNEEGSSGDNCKWTEYLPAPIGPQTIFSFCTPVNSTSFYVTIPAPVTA